MAKVTYDKDVTALLVIDPYNDFISKGGKLWDRVRGVAEANNCVPNTLQVLNAARRAELRVFYWLRVRSKFKSGKHHDSNGSPGILPVCSL
jgi:ureidoacrylate peracid hydrolase